MIPDTSSFSDDLYRKEEKRIKSILKDLTTFVKDDKYKKKLNEWKLLQIKRDFKSFLSSNVVDVDANHEDILNSSYKIQEIFDVDKLILNANTDFKPSAKVYQLSNVAEGFYICRNLLTNDAQYKWSKKAIKDFSQVTHTNITNLENINNNNNNNNNNSDNSIKELDSIQSPSNKTIVSTKNELTTMLSKLRWACLGYHYNWSLRMYVENSLSNIPADLITLFCDTASLVRLPLKPEAVIINYYPLNGTMSGHLDDAEHNMDEPIVSFSLGCDCIFLIGGRTKHVQPVPVYLRSGYAIIMSGESRYCFHGVPVIIPSELSILHNNYDEDIQLLLPSNETINDKEEEEDEEMLFIYNYMKNNRININTRRVTRSDGVWQPKNGSGYKSVS